METQRNKGGRPEGSHQTLARRAREEASRTGLLPHEILLDMARGNPQKVRTVKEAGDSVVVEEAWVSVTIDMQRDAAKAAAPYYAPKLATVETVKGMNDDDLDELIRQFATQAGIGSLAGGEGQEDQAQAGPRGPAAGPGGRRRRDL